MTERCRQRSQLAARCHHRGKWARMISVTGHPAQKASAAMAALTSGLRRPAAVVVSTAPGTLPPRRQAQTVGRPCRRLHVDNRTAGAFFFSFVLVLTGSASIASSWSEPLLVSSAVIGACSFRFHWHAPWRRLWWSLEHSRSAGSARSGALAMSQWALRRGMRVRVRQLSCPPDMRPQPPRKRERQAPCKIQPQQKTPFVAAANRGHSALGVNLH